MNSVLIAYAFLSLGFCLGYVAASLARAGVERRRHRGGPSA